MDSTISFKAVFGDDVRRITAPATISLTELTEMLQQRYSVSSMTLKWTDEDGDVITIADDTDLQEALTTSKLRIVVTAAANKPSAAAGGDVNSAVDALAAALDLDLPAEFKENIVNHLSHAAPMLKSNPGMIGMMGMMGPGMMGGRRGGCRWGRHRGGCGPCGHSSEDGQVRHWGITCDVTGQSPIVGVRYHKIGVDYDLCESEFLKLSEKEQTLYEKIEQPPVKHWGVSCDASGMYPIVGVRYTKIGDNYDLCEAEFNKLSAEEQALFQKIDIPQRRGCMGQGMRMHQPEPESFGPVDATNLPDAPLQRGSRGTAVANLQQALIQLGHMHPQAVRFARGMYGPRTTQAVAALQERYQMDPTGVFDSDIRTKILAELAGKYRAAENTTSTTSTTEATDPAAAAEAAAVEAAAKAAEEAEANERAALLISMGFSEDQVKGALEATKGSLERAADWLFVNRPVQDVEELPSVPVFKEEWAEVAADLVEMGFEEERAKHVLVQTDGDFKAAIKLMVDQERNA